MQAFLFHTALQLVFVKLTVYFSLGKLINHKERSSPCISDQNTTLMSCVQNYKKKSHYHSSLSFKDWVTSVIFTGFKIFLHAVIILLGVSLFCNFFCMNKSKSSEITEWNKYTLCYCAIFESHGMVVKNLGRFSHLLATSQVLSVLHWSRKCLRSIFL